MAAKLPLKSNTADNSTATAGGEKTIEEVVYSKTKRELILRRPQIYIGSTEKRTGVRWVFEKDEMVKRFISYVPGLYKIFDEILVNVADQKQRDPTMDFVKVDIDPDNNLISVYNNGYGVPVEIDRKEGVYVPEVLFSHLDDAKTTMGGRNGYGAKLANIFSTKFVIQTADGKRQRKYEQVFLENMRKKLNPTITKCETGDNWTKVSFKPNLAIFKMADLENDVVALMNKRVVELAVALGKGVKVELNGTRVSVKTFTAYVDLYLKSANKTRKKPLPRIIEKTNNRWEVCVSLSEGYFEQVSFVNGIQTIKGGTHVEYVTSQITNHVAAFVNKKNKNANLKAHNVKNHLWVFVSVFIDNPAFDSHEKETLTTRQGSFGSMCELSEEFLEKVDKSEIMKTLISGAKFKQIKELKKTDGSKRQNVNIPKLVDAKDAGGENSTDGSKRQNVNITKLLDAKDAGGENSDKCTLIMTEGDSAKTFVMVGLSVLGYDRYGVFPLKGKLLNVREASDKRIKENVEIQNIKQILGLQEGKHYDSVKGLRYGSLMILTDQDHDGSHIKGLLINLFHVYWPC